MFHFYGAILIIQDFGKLNRVDLLNNSHPQAKTHIYILTSVVEGVVQGMGEVLGKFGFYPKKSEEVWKLQFFFHADM